MGKTLKDRNTQDRLMRQKDNGWKRTTQVHEDRRKVKYKKAILCKDCNNVMDECTCK